MQGANRSRWVTQVGVRGLLPVAAAALLCCCFLASLTLAQESRAILSGRVVDPQGAAVPGAKVEARNLDTNVVAAVTTNESGLYTLPPLNPGRYSVTVSVAGFKTLTQSGIELRAADRRQVDFSLELGALTETVTVTGEAPLVDASSASLGTTINKQLVSNLPVFGRNSFTLLRYATGVVYTPGRASSGERPFDNGGMDAVTINGGPARANEYLIDGISNTNNTDSGQGVYLTFAPPPDAVEEFKVQTNLYDAEYGRTGGGVISVSLKSGTNAYHGAAYWYVRNDKLNANDTASNAAGRPLSAFRWNQPGAQFQGPVRLPGIYNGSDRTFFMWNWEAIRSSVPRPSNMVLPTMLERNGDFSRTYVSGTSGPVVAIYDPLSTVETSPGTYTRTVAFPGSIIPPSRINSIAKKITEYYPKPAIENVARGVTNLTVSPNPTTDAYDIHTIRVDHNLTSSHKFFATFMRSNRHEEGGLGGGRAIFIEMGKRHATPTYDHWRTNHGANFNLTSTLSPTFISALRIGWNRHVFGIQQYAMGFDPANLGFPKSLSAQVQSLSFPTVSVGGYQTIGYSGLSTTVTSSDTWTVGETVTKLMGSHSLKFGADLRLLLNNLAPKSASFSVSFTNNFTRLNPQVSSASYGDGFASFLLGYPSSVSSSYQNQPAWGQRYYAFFVQDDWRVTRNFTLNLGLRWDYESPNTDRYDRIVRGFDPNVSYTIGTVAVKGGLVFADSTNRFPFKRDLNNVQGRLGMAYTVTRKLVLRGGWGMSYIPTAGDRAPSTGFTRTTSPSTSVGDAGIIPLVQSGCTGGDCGMLSNPFPTGILLPVGRSLGPRTNNGESLSYYWPDRSVPYVHNFSAGFQYELPFRTVAEATYVGTRSRQLATSKDINGITYAQYMANGSALSTNVSNPFAGLLPGTGMNGSTRTLEQSLRPFPQFTSITEMGRTIGTSRYDSLQVRVEKRLSAGLTTLFTGTWSRNTTYNTYLNGSMDAIGQFITRLGASPPQILQLTATYTIPLFQDSPQLVRTLLGGWTMAGTFSKQSGGLMSVSGARSTGLDPRISNPTHSRMFNTCTFNANTNQRQNCLSPDEPIAWIIDKPYTLLTQPQPQFNKWRSINPPNVNLALFKAFQIKESFQAELRAESFNAMNTPVIVNPNTSATSSLFGRIASISQSNDPRSVQLSLRLSF